MPNPISPEQVAEGLANGKADRTFDKYHGIPTCDFLYELYGMPYKDRIDILNKAGKILADQKSPITVEATTVNVGKQHMEGVAVKKAGKELFSTAMDKDSVILSSCYNSQLIELDSPTSPENQQKN
jgi:hypothetical protein